MTSARASRLMPEGVSPSLPERRKSRVPTRVATAASATVFTRQTEAPNGTERRALRAAWASFVRKYDDHWTHTFTFEFSEPQSQHSARRYFMRGWLPAIQRFHPEPLLWFASFEGYADHWHIHGLIRAPRPLNSSLLASAWKRGYQRVNRYDAGRGFAAYATKTLGTPGGFFEMSDPPAKRHRTRRSPRPRERKADD